MRRTAKIITSELLTEMISLTPEKHILTMLLDSKIKRSEIEGSVENVEKNTAQN
jgi:hypothetical protein